MAISNESDSFRVFVLEAKIQSYPAFTSSVGGSGFDHHLLYGPFVERELSLVHSDLPQFLNQHCDTEERVVIFLYGEVLGRR